MFSGKFWWEIFGGIFWRKCHIWYPWPPCFSKIYQTLGLGSTLYLSLSVSMCLCLCICLFVSISLGHCHHQIVSFQKIYGLYGLEHHTVHCSGDKWLNVGRRRRCHHGYKQTNNRTESENRATQLIDTGRWVSQCKFFKIQIPKAASLSGGSVKSQPWGKCVLRFTLNCRP